MPLQCYLIAYVFKNGYTCMLQELQKIDIFMKRTSKRKHCKCDKMLNWNTLEEPQTYLQKEMNISDVVQNLISTTLT